MARTKKRPSSALVGTLSTMLVVALTQGITAAAGAAPQTPASPTRTEVLQPDGPLAPSKLTPAQMAAVADRQVAGREKAAEQAQRTAPAKPGTAKPKPRLGPPTLVNDGLSAEALLIRRNERNTVATSSSNTLAEPSAANEGNSVFFNGNTYSSFSTNLGVSWTNVALPAGPADAPTACCDLDAVRAHAVDRLITTLLYTNAAQTNGVVRIFVRNDPSAAPLCSYTIDPAGAADNILPDYPHIGLTSGFLYLTMNNLTNGATWLQAQVRRFNLSQMAACTGVTTDTFNHVGTVGQRILTPIEGAQNTTTMYFAAIESNSQLRIIRWPESSTTPTQVVRNLGITSSFTNPDCRGGTGDFDWIERATAFSNAGFRMRGARHGTRITWFWNAGTDAGHTQAHVQGASFNEADQTLVETPDIFSTTLCFGFPVISGNAFGDLGISIAAGGQAGGGGSAAQGFVGVDDTPGDPIHFGTVILTASGTHNRSDARFGDYFTVRTNARCQNAWVGTNYALLNGNTTSAHVNARYVEFGSTLDDGCF